jgi:hypothetical protein
MQAVDGFDLKDLILKDLLYELCSKNLASGEIRRTKVQYSLVKGHGRASGRGADRTSFGGVRPA